MPQLRSSNLQVVHSTSIIHWSNRKCSSASCGQNQAITRRIYHQTNKLTYTDNVLERIYISSYMSSSSSNSPSSSAVASWYCWYSDTRSFMLDSASVNSISSIPSPVYQCRNALRRNMAVKYSATRLNISWIAVELPRKVTAIFKPFGGISQMPVLMLFGIHSTKYDEFLFCTFSICSSTSLADIRPRNKDAAVKYRPWRGSAAHIMFFASNICCVSSGTVSARYCCEPRDVSGAKPFIKKWRRGKGIMLTASLRMSQFSCPGKRKQHVTPDRPALTKWFRSPYVGVVSFNVRKQMS